MTVCPSKPMAADEYWRAHAQRGEPLKALGRPCHDCAVVFGLYSELSDDLAGQPIDIITAVSERWFCHSHPNRACAGNIERVAAAIEARKGRDPQGLGAKHESAVPKGAAQTQSGDPTHG